MKSANLADLPRPAIAEPLMAYAGRMYCPPVPLRTYELAGSILDAMREHADARWPCETCGLIDSASGRHWPCENVQDDMRLLDSRMMSRLDTRPPPLSSQEAFFVSPDDQIRAHQECADIDTLWHSHITSPPHLSDGDIAGITKPDGNPAYPHQIVLSLGHGSVRAFSWYADFGWGSADLVIT